MMMILKKLFQLFSKREIKPENEQIIKTIKSRIAKANGATITHFSLERKSPENNGATESYVNKDCNSLEEFVINDSINAYDLKKLAELNNIQLAVAGGWYDIVLDLIKELDTAGWDRRVSCIKEKYAGLRFYTDSRYDAILDKYELKSETTCESCGKKGSKRYNTGWEYVACRAHYLENRGSIKATENGFIKDGVSYQWKDVADASFEDLYGQAYEFLKFKFKKHIVKHAGWVDDELLVSTSTPGFGSFVQDLAKQFKSLNDAYISLNYGKAEPCDICGYFALYSNTCECCEHTKWTSEEVNFWEKEKYIKHNQLYWIWDEGEVYASQMGLYRKFTDFQVLYTDQELQEYLNG